MNEQLDIVTIGESMLRLTPPAPHVLEQAPYFEVRAAGAESNVAIAAARMGLRTGWISSLPPNPLGRRVASAIRGHGVDVSRVLWTDGGRVGIYFIDSDQPGRSRDTIYDRAGSAITELTPDQLDWEYLSGARVLHTSGITLALGEGPREIVARALQGASEHQQLVSFDLNYRSKLWTPGKARQIVEPILTQVDILCAGLEEASVVLGLSGRGAAVAESLFEKYSPKVVVITDGPRDSVAYDGTLHTSTPRPVTVVDRIGAGDAFVAGFLAGYLEKGVEFGLAMATALGALKLTYVGDVAWCTREEVLEFMADHHPPSR